MENINYKKFKQDVIQFGLNNLSYNMIKNDNKCIFNQQAWNKCGELGVQGWPIPQKYGGKGLSILKTIYGLQGLGYACKDNGLLFGISAHLWACAMPILSFGNETQKKHFLPLLSNGNIIAAHSATEPQAGSDVYSLTTTATKHKDTFILNGEKHYVTNGGVADIFIIFATTDITLGQKGISVFIVHRDNPGLIISPKVLTMGDRTCEIIRLKLQNCEVKKQHLLGQEGIGALIFSRSMEWERGFILTPAIGTMERLLDQSIKYARTHKQFGQPIGRFQLVSSKIVDMKIRLENCKSHITNLAHKKDNKKTAIMEAAIANLYISESWFKSTINAMEIHGGNGYMTEMEIERELRDALGSKFYSGTSEIQKTVIAKFLGF